MEQNFKTEIIKTVQKIEEEKFLRYLYILVKEMLNKSVKV